MIKIFTKKGCENLAPFFLGLIGFLLVVGIAPLNPKNINWLIAWDAVENYVGWVFYRYDDWRMPIGLNPKNGLEISSSIVYSDSIPIAAILLKPFSSLLSEPFQYFGIWYLLCYILQAWFSWLLVSLFTKDFWIKFLSVGLFVFAPPFMWKAGMTEMVGTHPAPASHFLIIAALYLVFNTSKYSKIWQWALLLSITCLVNFYIFVMVFILWSTNYLDRKIIQKASSGIYSIKEILIVSISVLISAWQAGYFVKKGVPLGDIGYGFFRMPALSLFDSRGWSYLIRPFQQANDIDNTFNLPLEVGIVHGFQYIGAGGLVILCITVFTLLYSTAAREWSLQLIQKNLFLVFGLVCLTAFAISNNISIAQYNFYIPLPDSIINFAGILRSSGRMFWPVFYLILLLILVINFKHLNLKIFKGILFICFIFQVADTSAGWLQIHQKLKRDSIIKHSSRFTAEIWNDLATEYKKILSYPLKNSIFQNNWEHIARFASNKKIATNSVYLARIDERKVRKANQDFIEALKTRNFDSEAIYILDDSLLLPTLLYMNPQEDLLAIIPNFLSFIPNRKQCKSCSKIPKEWELSFNTSKFITTNFVKFDSSNIFLIPMLAGGHGWNKHDNQIYLPKKGEAKLVLPIPSTNSNFLDFNFEYHDKGGRLPLYIQVSTDDGPWKTIELKNSGTQIISSIEIPSSSLNNGFISVTFKKFQNYDLHNLKLVNANFR